MMGDGLGYAFREESRGPLIALVAKWPGYGRSRRPGNRSGYLTGAVQLSAAINLSPSIQIKADWGLRRGSNSL